MRLINQHELLVVSGGAGKLGDIQCEGDGVPFQYGGGAISSSANGNASVNVASGAGGAVGGATSSSQNSGSFGTCVSPNVANNMAQQIVANSNCTWVDKAMNWASGNGYSCPFTEGGPTVQQKSMGQQQNKK